MHGHNSLLEELRESGVTPLGEGSWKLASGFLQTFTDAFAFGDFALHISMVIHHSFEYRYVLIPLSPPRESCYPGVTWGPPTQLT